MSSPTRATEPALAFPATAAVAAATTEKPKSTKGRAVGAAKREATKDVKEPAAPAAKEKKEKKAAEEKKAEENAEEEDGAEDDKKAVAKKRKAGGGHGGSRDHPSFEEIIRECIRESKEDRREGVSRPTIKSTCSVLCSRSRFWPPFALPSPAARWAGEVGEWGAASVWYAPGADVSVGAEFMESRYGLEMTSLTVANINRAILKGQEKGVFELPKGPSGKVKLAKAAEDKEVRCGHSGLPSVAPDSCVPEENATLSRLHRTKPPLARLRLALPPCTKPRRRESVRLLVQLLVRLPRSLRGQLRRYADSRFRGAFCALLSLTSIYAYVYVYVASPYFSRASSLDRSPRARAPMIVGQRPKKARACAQEQHQR